MRCFFGYSTYNKSMSFSSYSWYKLDYITKKTKKKNVKEEWLFFFFIIYLFIYLKSIFILWGKEKTPWTKSWFLNYVCHILSTNHMGHKYALDFVILHLWAQRSPIAAQDWSQGLEKRCDGAAFICGAPLVCPLLCPPTLLKKLIKL